MFSKKEFATVSNLRFILAEQNSCSAELSMKKWKKFYNLGAWSVFVVRKKKICII